MLLTVMIAIAVAPGVLATSLKMTRLVRATFIIASALIESIAHCAGITTRSHLQDAQQVAGAQQRLVLITHGLILMVLSGTGVSARQVIARPCGVSDLLC
jgi:hypothetical protein